MIPKALSGEAEQDSEPSLAVDPTDPRRIVATAFTPDPMGTGFAPIFVSSDGGMTWAVRSTVPSANITGDISMWFGGSGRLYGGILKVPGRLLLNVLRTTDAFATTPMGVVVNRSQVDQPFVRAQTVGTRDRVYVGSNDFGSTGGRTATLDISLNGAGTNPQFQKVRIERRGTGSAGQDGPQIRPAVHPGGTVYAAFYGWRSFSATDKVTTDVVVVRDDQGGNGPQAFSALGDPSDNLAGRLVARGVTFVWSTLLGNQRTGGDIAIAVDPRNSRTVYLSWAGLDGADYTLNLRMSTDGGATWSANNLRTKKRATNPALAVNARGTVCFLYQQVTGNGANERWVTTIERSSDNGSDLAVQRARDRAGGGSDAAVSAIYRRLRRAGQRREHFLRHLLRQQFPRSDRFPSGVTYQRNHDFQTRRLFDVNGATQVSVSIDPFFFKVTD